MAVLIEKGRAFYYLKYINYPILMIIAAVAVSPSDLVLVLAALFLIGYEMTGKLVAIGRRVCVMR